MSTLNTDIQKAIDSNDIERARTLLRDALPSADAETYYLASLVALNDDQKTDFLKKAIERDPFHVKSSNALQKSKGSASTSKESQGPWRRTFRTWGGILRFVVVGIIACGAISWLAQSISQWRLDAEAYTAAANLLTQFDNSQNQWGRVDSDKPFQVLSVSHFSPPADTPWFLSFADGYCVTFMPPLTQQFSDSTQERNFQVKNAIISRRGTLDGLAWEIYALNDIERSTFTQYGCNNWLEEGDVSDTQ